MSLSFKVKVDTSEFKSIVNKYRKETTSTTFARKVSKHLTKLSNSLVERIRNKLIDDNTLPKSYVFRATKRKKPNVRFTLPKRLKYPRNRTGELRNSIKVIRGKRTNIEGFRNYKQLYIALYVGIDKRNKYGRILEKGGTIRPKKRKFLSIPIDKESWGKSPREFDNLKLFGRILARKSGKFTYKPLYLLVRKSHIKAFHYIRDGKREFLKSNEYKQILKELELDLSRWLKYSLKSK